MVKEGELGGKAEGLTKVFTEGVQGMAGLFLQRGVTLAMATDERGRHGMLSLSMPAIPAPGLDRLVREDYLVVRRKSPPRFSQKESRA